MRVATVRPVEPASQIVEPDWSTSKSDHEYEPLRISGVKMASGTADDL